MRTSCLSGCRNASTPAWKRSPPGPRLPDRPYVGCWSFLLVDPLSRAAGFRRQSEGRLWRKGSVQFGVGGVSSGQLSGAGAGVGSDEADDPPRRAVTAAGAGVVLAAA